MLKFELKKVFARTSNKIALLILLGVMGVTCYFAMGVSWVDENGETHRGPAAVAQLRAMQKEWAGYLDEEAIRRAIEENQRIQSMPEAQSDNLRDSEISYSRGQGLLEIRNRLNSSFASGFREYDYYRMDSLTPEDAPDFYTNRVRLLREWLAEEAKDQFSEEEKAFLVKRYESLDLTREQRIIINDYIACTSTVNHRYSDIAYMAGIKNTVTMFASLGLIKGMDEKK